MKLELSKKIIYHDSELDTIDFDLNTLTGYDILEVESELRATGINIAVWDYSREFLINIAARSCHLPVEVLKGLNISDFTRVVNEVMLFLSQTVSKNTTGENSDA